MPTSTELGRILGVSVLLLLFSCGRQSDAPAETKPPAASIEHENDESMLATVRLSPDAEERLGIVVSAVQQRTVARQRLFGGDVVLPPLSTTSPASRRHGENQSIFAVLPALTPNDLIRVAEAQIDAEGQIEQTRVQLEAAKQALSRTEALLRGKSASERAVEEARVRVESAQIAVRTAEERRALLGPPVLDFSIPKQVWVRVGVYVGDLLKLDRGGEARVGSLGDRNDAATRPARPVAGPPAANPSAASADLFYEVNNEDGELRIGQRVGVRIPLREAAGGLVVQSSAVIRDVEGGTWVYQQIAPHSFARRRVQLRFIDSDAVIDSGLESDARVVVSGAAELFGTEFGIGH